MTSPIENYKFSQFPLARPANNRKSDPRDYRITMASGAMIFAHNKILLNRSDSSDMWSIPGGTVEFSESCEQTVLRELKEEMNLEVEIIDHLPFIFTFELDNDEVVDRILLLHFLVKVKGKAKIVIGDGIADYKWESIASNFRDCYPNVQPAVDHFMKI